MNIRRSHQRGHANHGWLDSRHTFSFAGYYDPQWMGYANLRVINEDKIAAGMGFGEHPHRDMEIVSYVLEGELAHRDNMGNVKGIKPGEVQRMSAGSGVTHSEFNHAQGQTTHFLQIWIEPNKRGIVPEYSQQAYSDADKRGRLLQVLKPYEQTANADNAQAIEIHADASLFVGLFDGAEQAQKHLQDGHVYYVHVARGSVNVNGERLHAGDAAMIEDGGVLALSQGDAAEVLVFELVP
ncbi:MULTISPECIES: pirin family protein [Vitreoscilla]|uniref:Pirin family protein n=1 Tax=Vitreoscilla stercoraria TaxID=61 RepID=A0ABY4EBS1_VITST|nr:MULTISPECIES: pirin family protein [Vitreoscilla]AUZ05704.1 putative pirin [Vitreoscilla sp. C1]UOO92897.1 pirin family protein [Vitreoscilla stercoraria]